MGAAGVATLEKEMEEAVQIRSEIRSKEGYRHASHPPPPSLFSSSLDVQTGPQCQQNMPSPSFGWAAQQAVHSVLCSSVYRCASVCCTTVVQVAMVLTSFLLAGPKLNLQVAECSIQFPFTQDTAQQLSQAMTQLLQTFSEKQKAERPKRWPMMEFRCSGGPWLCL